MEGPSETSFTAVGKVDIWILPKTNFLETLDSTSKSDLLHRMEMQDLNLDLREIKLFKELSKDSFGQVYLAVGNKPEQLFAVKCVHKNKVVRHQAYTAINLERELLL